MLFIPLIFMNLFTFNNAIRQLTEEVEDATMTKLKQTADVIDARLEGLNHIAAQLPRDQHIRSFLYAQNINKMSEYDFYLMIKALSDYRATNTFIDNIYIFFKNTDISVSADGKYDIFTFFSQVFRYDKMSRIEFMEMLNNISERVYRPAERVFSGKFSKEIISYLQPIPMSETNPKATLIISMRIDSVNRLLRTALGEYSGCSYILDDNGNIISSIIDNDIIEEDTISYIIKNLNGSSVKYQKINGINMMICSVRSNKTGWIYLALIPSNQILSKVIDIKLLAVIIIVITIIIGIGMALYFSYLNYNPIRKIADRLTRYSNSEFESKYNDELEIINNVLTTILSKDASMEYLLDKYVPSVRANFLMRLLNGDFLSKQEAYEIGNFVDISISEGPFAVMVFDIDDYEDFVKLNSVITQNVYRFSICNVAEELCKNLGNNGYAVEVSGNRVAMIVNFKEENANYTEQMSEVGNSIAKFFVEHFEFSLTVGIGRVYEDIMDISKSYIEAQTAIEYKIVKGKNAVIIFDDMLTTADNNHYYTLHHQNIIINSLKQGDFESIYKVLSSVIEDINQNPVSINMAKCVYFEIINTAMKALGELDPQDYNEIMHHGAILPNFFECETLIDVYNRTVKFYQTICERIRKIMEADINDNKNSIIEYVKNNFYDKNMSLSLLADKFDQTPSSISRLFKNEVGYNFVDYLHRLRLDKAKELLKNTDISISDIALKCGYLSSHSFIRSFKKYNLITPGRYRELNKK